MASVVFIDVAIGANASDDYGRVLANARRGNAGVYAGCVVLDKRVRPVTVWLPYVPVKGESMRRLPIKPNLYVADLCAALCSC